MYYGIFNSVLPTYIKLYKDFNLPNNQSFDLRKGMEALST
jgi:hypothetical protein